MRSKSKLLVLSLFLTTASVFAHEGNLTTVNSVSDQVVYIRCRALSANGDVIYGDFDRATGDINVSAEQALRNFLGTRCGGPLGGRCARPVKCNGYDARLNDLGQVLEK